MMQDETLEHPGPYRGRRNDFQALSEYWAKRARFFEAERDRYREALERIAHDDWMGAELIAREALNGDTE